MVGVWDEWPSCMARVSIVRVGHARIMAAGLALGHHFRAAYQVVDYLARVKSWRTSDNTE